MDKDLIMQIGVGPGVYGLLKAAGKSASKDAREGRGPTDRYAAWAKACDQYGLKDIGRTPAQEAFFDGWYDA